LDLRLLVDTQLHRRVRRVQVQPDDFTDVADDHGSDDSLKLSTRCGLNPIARQIFDSVVWDIPAALAIATFPTTSTCTSSSNSSTH
jgi:hypothetical protein